MIERPKLMRDWIGLKVKTHEQIELTNGVIFPPGTEFTVDRVYHGLSLESVAKCPGGCPGCGILHRHYVRKVRPEELDIVQEDDQE